jgi:hypothetical protein
VNAIQEQQKQLQGQASDIKGLKALLAAFGVLGTGAAGVEVLGSKTTAAPTA